MAWLSSLGGLNDPILFRLRFGLKRFVEPAWNHLVEALKGTESKFWSSCQHVLPPTFDGFLDGSMFSPANDAKVKISKFVLKSLSSVRMERFLSLSSVECLGESLSASDVLRANAPTFAGRVFTSSLKYTFPLL